MSWLVLVVSGGLEAVWATALSRSEGFTPGDTVGPLRCRAPAQHGRTRLRDEVPARRNGVRGVGRDRRRSDGRLRHGHSLVVAPDPDQGGHVEDGRRTIAKIRARATCGLGPAGSRPR